MKEKRLHLTNFRRYSTKNDRVVVQGQRKACSPFSWVVFSLEQSEIPQLCRQENG